MRSPPTLPPPQNLERALARLFFVGTNDQKRDQNEQQRTKKVQMETRLYDLSNHR